MNTTPVEEATVPPPIRVTIDSDLDALLTREWLLTNRIGAYASSTVLGCNSRRYHGLLVAPAVPPVGRLRPRRPLDVTLVDTMAY